MVVRNLAPSLRVPRAQPCGDLGGRQDGAAHGDSGAPRRRTRVGVLISGTGLWTRVCACVFLPISIQPRFRRLAF